MGRSPFTNSKDEPFLGIVDYLTFFGLLLIEVIIWPLDKLLSRLERFFDALNEKLLISDSWTRNLRLFLQPLRALLFAFHLCLTVALLSPRLIISLYLLFIVTPIIALSHVIAHFFMGGKVLKKTIFWNNQEANTSFQSIHTELQNKWRENKNLYHTCTILLPNDSWLEKALKTNWKKMPLNPVKLENIYITTSISAVFHQIVKADKGQHIPINSLTTSLVDLTKKENRTILKAMLELNILDTISPSKIPLSNVYFLLDYIDTIGKIIDENIPDTLLNPDLQEHLAGFFVEPGC